MNDLISILNSQNIPAIMTAFCVCYVATLIYWFAKSFNDTDSIPPEVEENETWKNETTTIKKTTTEE